MYGTWQTSPEAYVDDVRRFASEIGNMRWAAIQDWMCEPVMLAKTGLTVEEHQRRTVDNYTTLLHLAPELPWTPVLQGWAQQDYWTHVDMYTAAGFDLRRLPTVGVGSVCRRQHLAGTTHLLEALYSDGFENLHGFGLKITGLLALKEAAAVRGGRNALQSADSMAWSFAARRKPPLEGCTTHINCANCIKYATMWYDDLIERLDECPKQ